MLRYQAVAVSNATITVKPLGRADEHLAFSSTKEAVERAAVLAEALDWVGTPFLDCAAIKGPKGGVDCVELTSACYVSAGLVAPYKLPKYSPDRMRHSNDEMLLRWIADKGGKEVDAPQIGDLVAWHFGRCFSHCGILINAAEVVHAFKYAKRVMPSRLDTGILKFNATHAGTWPRPVKYFSFWV